MNVDAYRALAHFLSVSGVSNLNLTVVDNGFNAEKARILFEGLSSTRLTGFTFKNSVLDCNYHANEADDFKQNMAGIKTLSFPSVITWGSMTV